MSKNKDDKPKKKGKDTAPPPVNKTALQKARTSANKLRKIAKAKKMAQDAAKKKARQTAERMAHSNPFPEQLIRPMDLA
jgi:hypothetical protein